MIVVQENHLFNSMLLAVVVVDLNELPKNIINCDSSAQTQVEDYGHWIPQDPAGKKRKSHRILQESPGNSRKWKQYSDRKFVGLFAVDYSQFPVLSGRNRSEIIGKNPKNLRWQYCFHVPAVSGAFPPKTTRNFRLGDKLNEV